MANAAEPCKMQSVMHIGRHSCTIVYQLNGVELLVVTEIVDLGICMHATQLLTNSTSATNRARRLLFAIRRAFAEITPEILKHRYTTLVWSHLEYGLPVWKAWCWLSGSGGGLGS